MTDETKSPFVTRAELYPILSGVYVLIAFALLGLVRANEQDLLLVIGHFILFVVALGSSVIFTILGIRERRRRTKDRGLGEQVAADVAMTQSSSPK